MNKTISQLLLVVSESGLLPPLLGAYRKVCSGFMLLLSVCAGGDTLGI